MIIYDFQKQNVNAFDLAKEIEQNQNLPNSIKINFVPPQSLKIFFEFQLTSGQSTELATVVSNHSDLAAKKLSRIELIDLKTRDMIAAGFSFDDKQFSLSVEAQNNWSDILNMRILQFLLVVTSNLDALKEHVLGTPSGWQDCGDIVQELENLAAIFTYPFPITTKDDNQYLLQENDPPSFWQAGASVYIGALIGGRNLKVQVLQATTHAELDAIVDDR